MRTLALLVLMLPATRARRLRIVSGDYVVRDSGATTYAYADGHSNPYSDTNAHAPSDSYAHSYTHAHSYAYTYAKPNAHTYSNAYSNAYSNSHCHAHANPGAVPVDVVRPGRVARRW